MNNNQLGCISHLQKYR